MPCLAEPLHPGRSGDAYGGIPSIMSAAWCCSSSGVDSAQGSGYQLLAPAGCLRGDVKLGVHA